MKVKDIPIFRQRILDALPIVQAEIGKMLGIDHRDVSKLINAMVEEHLVQKTKADRTFLIEKYKGNGHEKKKDFSVLLANEKFSPCCGCDLECDPAHCPKLDEWIKGCIKEG